MIQFDFRNCFIANVYKQRMCNYIYHNFVFTDMILWELAFFVGICYMLYTQVYGTLLEKKKSNL